MTKALEALGRLWKAPKPINPYSTLRNRSDYAIIKQALTPPTEEEVCEALSKVENLRDVKYCKHKKEFYILFRNVQVPIARLNRSNYYLEITYALPTHLITMLGRYYEGRKQND